MRRVLYSLPELLKTNVVYIVEGEKNVNNLRPIGLTATLQSWRRWKVARGEYSTVFFSNMSV